MVKKTNRRRRTKRKTCKRGKSCKRIKTYKRRKSLKKGGVNPYFVLIPVLGLFGSLLYSVSTSSVDPQKSVKYYEVPKEHEPTPLPLPESKKIVYHDIKGKERIEFYEKSKPGEEFRLFYPGPINIRIPGHINKKLEKKKKDDDDEVDVNTLVRYWAGRNYEQWDSVEHFIAAQKYPAKLGEIRGASGEQLKHIDFLKRHQNHQNTL